MTPVPTVPRNRTSEGLVPLARGVGPQPVGARVLVVHKIPTHISVDAIFWHANKLGLGVSIRVVIA